MLRRAELIMKAEAEPAPPARDAVHVVGAAVLRRGRCLVACRGPSMADAGKWEFPGGKIEPGETPEDALRREIAEELGLCIEVGAWLGRGNSRPEGHRIVLDVYLATTDDEPQLTEHDACRWIEAKDIASLDWADADRPVLPALSAILEVTSA